MQFLNRVAVQPECHPETGTGCLREINSGQGLANREGDRRCGEEGPATVMEISSQTTYVRFLTC